MKGRGRMKPIGGLLPRLLFSAVINNSMSKPKALAKEIGFILKKRFRFFSSQVTAVRAGMAANDTLSRVTVGMPLLMQQLPWYR